MAIKINIVIPAPPYIQVHLDFTLIIKYVVPIYLVKNFTTEEITN